MKNNMSQHQNKNHSLFFSKHVYSKNWNVENCALNYLAYSKSHHTLFSNCQKDPSDTMDTDDRKSFS